MTHLLDSIIVWHLGDGWWDCALPKFLLAPLKLPSIIGIENITHATARTGIVMIPGRHSQNDYGALNHCLSKFENAMVCIIGDEEGVYKSDWLEHPNMRINWFMPPFNPKQKVNRVFPNGWPTDCPEILKEIGPQRRDLAWSFCGQMTHIRRVQCVAGLQQVKQNGHLLLSQGFTQGLPRREYYEIMLRSKLVLAPSGPCTPDSFRIAEALEAGCIPIVDELTQHASYQLGYWDYVLGENLPFPVLRDWDTLPQLVDEWLENWELKTERCQRWWSAIKRAWQDVFASDLRELERRR